MSPALAGLLAVGLLAVLPPASAQEARSPGALLAQSCFGCHRGDAGESALPSITGRNAAEVAQALLEFRDGSREATVMGRLARGYTVPELERIATYLSSAGGVP